jgi:hypothetical protein
MNLIQIIEKNKRRGNHQQRQVMMLSQNRMDGWKEWAYQEEKDENCSEVREGAGDGRLGMKQDLYRWFWRKRWKKRDLTKREDWGERNRLYEKNKAMVSNKQKTKRNWEKRGKEEHNMTERELGEDYHLLNDWHIYGTSVEEVKMEENGLEGAWWKGTWEKRRRRRWEAQAQEYEHMTTWWNQIGNLQLWNGQNMEWQLWIHCRVADNKLSWKTKNTLTEWHRGRLVASGSPNSVCVCVWEKRKIHEETEKVMKMKTQPWLHCRSLKCERESRTARD